MQIHKGNKGYFATLDVGLNKRITLRKPFNLSRGRFSLTTHLKVASTFDGASTAACMYSGSSLLLSSTNKDVF